MKAIQALLATATFMLGLTLADVFSMTIFDPGDPDNLVLFHRDIALAAVLWAAAGVDTLARRSKSRKRDHQ